MSMLEKRIKSLISWLLLIYFVLYIVPPVSSFRSSPHGSDPGESVYAVDRDGSKAKLFLFDIVLWEQLKKTKNSEFLMSPSTDSSVSKGFTDFRENGQQALIDISSAFSRPVGFGRKVPLFNGARSSVIRFSCSGISPPVFF